MESNPNDTPLLSLRERFLKSWFPPAAVVGGIVTLIVAALRVRPAPRAATPAATTPTGPVQAGGAAASAGPEVRLEREYALSGIVGRAASAPPFRQSLLGVAVDAADQVHALGDGEVRVFGPDGSLIRQWRVAVTAECLAVGPDGRVYVGGAGRIDIYESDGRRVGGFAFGDAGMPSSVRRSRSSRPTFSSPMPRPGSSAASTRLADSLASSATRPRRRPSSSPTGRWISTSTRRASCAPPTRAATR